MARTLGERLDSIRENFASKAPPEALEVMHRQTDELRDSGILTRIPRPGDTLPAFELPSSAGPVVRSEDLLANGPLIVTFYRGSW